MVNSMKQRVLEAKEERAAYQKQQILLHPLPLISLTLNLPGGYFQYDDWKWLMESAVQEIDRAFDKEITEKNLRMGKWGPEGFWSVDRPIKGVKQKAIEIEEGHPLGRLFDMDVISRAGRSLSRGDLGISPRKCICCDSPAVECYMEKRHTFHELRTRISDMIDKGRNTE